MVVAFVALLFVNFLDAQCQEGEGEELEAVLGFSAVCDGGEEGVLCAGFFIGWGVEGADCAFD